MNGTSGLPGPEPLFLAPTLFLLSQNNSQPSTDNPFPSYITTIGIIISFLSMFGSLFTLLTFVILKNARQNKFFNLVFNIALADLITSIGGLIEIGESQSNTEYVLTALFRDFGIICSYFFTSCIAAVIYYAAKHELDDLNIQSKIRNTVYLGYIFAAIGITLPAFTGSYTETASSCWVAPGFSWDMVWFLTEFMFPSLFTLFFTITLFLKTSKIIEEENKWALVPNKSFKFLFWIPVIFLICNLPGTLFAIFCFNSQSFDFLRYINAFARDSQGLFHTLLYSIGIIGDILHEHFSKVMVDKRRKSTAVKGDGGVSLMQDSKGVVIY